ncbi:MAG: hypothetical protein K1X74_07140 [Pirellulales bacterium]|nr:hypothetical protein [Pirellulales bacterium]
MYPVLRTSFAQLGPTAARAVLGVTIVAIVASVAISLSPLGSDQTDAVRARPGDVALYRAIVDRVQQGAAYYPAVARELAERGYPTASVFNWRPPLLLWAIGKAPDPVWGQVVLGLAALALIGVGFAWLDQQLGMGTALLGGVLLCGAVMPCILGDLYLMSEVWAGVLLALSVAAYGVDRRRLGFAAGLAALFTRELILPYAGWCLVLAATQRRWREAACWTVSLAVYGFYLSQHWAMVQTLIDPGARAHDQGWVCFGGWAFLIAIAQMNAYLLVSPQWAAAVYLPLAILGLAAWQSPAGWRLATTTMMFLVAFAIVGQPFNQYWGSMLAPLLCFGAAASVKALFELRQAAAGGAPDREPTARLG